MAGPDDKQAGGAGCVSFYSYTSSNGLEIKINHKGKRTIEEAFFEYLTNPGPPENDEQ
jgi:hypothetical protein